MKTIFSSRRGHYLARVSVFLTAVALIVGMVSCGPTPTPDYDLSITSTAGGSVTTPGEGTFTYKEGTKVSLVATPDACHKFVNWTGDVGTISDVNDATTTIIMNGDYSITANFIAQYDLTISSTAGGFVTSPGEGTSTYDEGTLVNLLATPDACYRFVNWTGGVGTIADVDAASTTIMIQGNYSITANFEEEEAVAFADPNLEAAVREAIGKPTAPICPSDLEGLTALDASYMSIADLTGLEHCTRLFNLGLCDNQISDISPLANLTNLTDLYLEFNQISDLSPLANLTNLTWLNIGGGDPISDISPLANLTNLTVLLLYRTPISDTSPLANLTNLTRLFLEGNQISDISPLANLTNLTELDLQFVNQISDISPVANLTNLTHFYLGDSQISDISALANLTNLTELYFRDTHISDISPLANLTSLTQLGFLYGDISDVSPIADLTNLTWLELAYNQVSDISPLVQNEGLGMGDEVYLEGNSLSSDSINIYIPQLEARGVYVDY